MSWGDLIVQAVHSIGQTLSKTAADNEKGFDWPRWIADPPPAGYVWLAVVVSVGSLVLSVIALFLQRSDRSRDRRARVEDAWIKAVVLDECLPEFLTFLTTQNGLLLAIAQRPEPERAPAYLEASATFQRQSEELITRFQVLDVILASGYVKVADAVEALQDAVANHCAANSNVPGKHFEEFRSASALNATFSNCRTAVVNTLKTGHHGAAAT